MLNRETHPNTPSYLLFGTVVVLGVVAMRRVAEHLLFTTPPVIGESLITLVQLPFLAVILYVGHKIRGDAWNDQQAYRVLVWFSAGIVGFVGINLLVMTFISPTNSTIFFAWLAWAASLGGGAGVLTGYFEGKAIVRARAKEREVIRAQEAESREELLDYLNSLLRHEVLNTASVIQGYSTFILDKHDLDSDIEDSLETIDNQAVEMSSIIKDVRLLIQASKQEDTLETVDLRNILENELQKLSERFDNVETELTAPDDLSIHGDTLLRRIFSNLFSNAVEHNDSETPRVSTTVTTTDDEITVQISDNGPGFDESERDIVFDAKPNGTPNHGLGLMLVKKLTERYNADIELTETGPDGTTFTITFPRQALNADTEESKDSEGNTAADEPRDDTRTPSATQTDGGLLTSTASN